MSDGSLTFESAKEAAHQNGLEIRFPAPNELFIDLDSEEAFSEFLALYVRFIEQTSVYGYDVNYSKSGAPHRHVVVRLEWPVENEKERVLLQAALGSDRRRELLSWARIVKGNPHPVLFFEKPRAPQLPEGPRYEATPTPTASIPEF